MQIELQPALENDPIIQEAIRLGGVITEIEQHERKSSATMLSDPELQPFAQTLFDYLDTVHIITDDQKLSMLRGELLTLLQAGSTGLRDWLRDNRVVFPCCETEVAVCIVSLVQGTHRDPVNVITLRPIAVSAKSRKPAASRTRRLDLLAAPEDAPQPKRQQPEHLDDTAPLQLALF